MGGKNDDKETKARRTPRTSRSTRTAAGNFVSTSFPSNNALTGQQCLQCALTHRPRRRLSPGYLPGPCPSCRSDVFQVIKFSTPKLACDADVGRRVSRLCQHCAHCTSGHSCPRTLLSFQALKPTARLVASVFRRL